MANDSEFGLAGIVYTGDTERAGGSTRLVAGTVGSTASCGTCRPLGGFRNSGVAGRAGPGASTSTPTSRTR